MSAPNSEPLEDNENDLELGLLKVERSLAALKQRIVKIKEDSQTRDLLQQKQKKLKQQQKNNNTKEQIKTELALIEQELETIERNLESRLLKWKDLVEPFWQALRFGGAGIIIGWILKTLIQ